MIKELWTLAKMLFATKPSEIEEVKLMGMEHFPSESKDYMPWCGHLIYRKDQLAVRRKEWITKEYKKLKQQENIRLDFAKEAGSWWKFYWHSLIN
jgi:hypothetical protein